MIFLIKTINISSKPKSATDQKIIVAINEICTNSEEKGRRPNQKRLIISIIDELKYERRNIPIGGKQKVLEMCLIKKNIFTSESVFNRVWSELSKSDQISITDKKKYL